MKKIIAILACLGLLAGLAACMGGDGGLSNLNLVSEYHRDLAGTHINVYNWGEYISEDSMLNVIRAFRALTGITVNYSYFSTNEEMYMRLTSGGAAYDIIFPSDYMIQRLIAEDWLLPLDFDHIPNFSFVPERFRNLFFDPDGLYSVPYTYGMVGLIYNSAMVHEPPTSWEVLWDERYAGQILQFDSSRDAFGVAQYLLGIDINSHDVADWRAAAEKLKEQAPLVQNYVADEIYDIMGANNAILGPYYAGDFLMMAMYNEDLAFVYPEEGTNFFYDSIVIPRSAQNKEGAEMFINFLLEPDVAMRNAETIMYASPHTAVIEHPDYSFYGNPILYPDEENMPIVQRFEHLPDGIIRLKNELWMEIRQITERAW